MRLLLDTHTALWWINEHERLSPTAKAMLLDESNELYLSVVTLWEIAIKVSLNKLSEMPGGVEVFIAKVEELPVQLVSLLPQYTSEVEKLPFIHRDPFDRMLITTAVKEGMTILTSDENIHRYDVPTVW
ncbi:MAG: type II toxin-antitoxin system VapC family toxin [Defluviitaleaceae bacterium]|nr:type II toxin-antitoxin system VapC family toxin [Defluviitaleaceae bacterium]